MNDTSEILSQRQQLIRQIEAAKTKHSEIETQAIEAQRQALEASEAKAQAETQAIAQAALLEELAAQLGAAEAQLSKAEKQEIKQFECDRAAAIDAGQKINELAISYIDAVHSFQAELVRLERVHRRLKIHGMPIKPMGETNNALGRWDTAKKSMPVATTDPAIALMPITEARREGKI